MSVVLSTHSSPANQKRTISKLKDRINLEVEKAQRGIKSADEGTLFVKNSAIADSIFVYNHNTEEWKNSDGTLIMREIPSYNADSYVLNELETSYYNEEIQSFAKDMKQLVNYDDEGRIIRLETHYWTGSDWQPSNLSITEFFPDGTQKKYEYYSFYESNWVLEYGNRIIITYNGDNMVTSKTEEEYYSYKEWHPIYKTDYYYGEDYSDVTITYLYFDYYELNDWTPEYKEQFILNENREWESGFGYFWNWETEEWIPEYNYTQFIWHNFEKQQYSYFEIQINNDLNGWKLTSEVDRADINWINYIKITTEYDELDRNIYDEMFFWYTEEDGNDKSKEWYSYYRMITEYDHLGNMFNNILEINVGDDEFAIMSGIFVDFVYNDDNSISSYIINYFQNDKGFEPFKEYEYFYYQEDNNSIPNIAFNNVNIYPNPTSSVLNFSSEFLNEQFDLRIMNLNGQMVYNSNVNLFGNTEVIDVNFLNSGCYIIQLKNNSRTIITRFIKN